MKKEDFVTLILSTVGGIFFALGMCMCLVPQWNAFTAGVAIGAAGLAVLLVMVLVRRKMQKKAPVKFTRKTLGIIALSIAGALLLGVGMCMCMVWEGLLIGGVMVGTAGIVALLCLIPLCKGLK